MSRIELHAFGATAQAGFDVVTADCATDLADAALSLQAEARGEVQRPLCCHDLRIFADQFQPKSFKQQALRKAASDETHL